MTAKAPEKPPFIDLRVRNLSERKRLYRRDDLGNLVKRICLAEGFATRSAGKTPVTLEISVLFCDDPFIQELNAQYRDRNQPTDVLSFSQADLPSPPDLCVLGDIVISLETVERFCRGDRRAMRDEVKLLFCHGLLHLMGYTHDTTAEQKQMQSKQAGYLDIDNDAAWHVD